VSSQAPSLPVIQPGGGTRSRLVRRAKLLSWLSLAWMTIEGTVGAIAGLAAGSVALTGFGLDSVVEGAASVIVIWRFTGGRESSEAAALSAPCDTAPLAPSCMRDAISRASCPSPSVWLPRSTVDTVTTGTEWGVGLGARVTCADIQLVRSRRYSAATPAKTRFARKRGRPLTPAKEASGPTSAT
jgi:hypothetical protein